MRPLLDYGDIIYDQPHNEFVCEKLESVQYKVALAITGAIQGTSREKIYQELGLESIRARRWYKRLSYMFKIVKEEASNYLINLIPKFSTNYLNKDKPYANFSLSHRLFQEFFPSTLNNWHKLDETIRPSESISIFKSRLLSFIRPLESNVYNIFDPIGLKFLTRLGLGFSQLNEHRFRHNFQDCMNRLCSCSLEIEDTSHYHRITAITFLNTALIL